MDEKRFRVIETTAQGVILEENRRQLREQRNLKISPINRLEENPRTVTNKSESEQK